MYVHIYTHIYYITYKSGSQTKYIIFKPCLI